MPPRAMSSINPLWPHYLSAAAILLALVGGLLRVMFLDWSDPFHCNALLHEGEWLDREFKNWQPEGCMMHKYGSKDIGQCLHNRPVVFIGDSVTRQLYFGLAHLADPDIPSSLPLGSDKHSDYSYTSRALTLFKFYWDPFLNTSNTRDLLNGGDTVNPPALLVIGTGLWFLRYAETSGGLSAWENTVDSVLAAVSQRMPGLADEVVFLPTEVPVSELLSDERAASIHPADVDAMNSDLTQRLSQPQRTPSVLPNPYASPRRRPEPVSLPLVFNTMLDPSHTKDGLHFSEPIVSGQAQVILNLRCNDELSNTFPMDKTCCRRYPSPSWLQCLCLFLIVAWGPLTYFLTPRLQADSSLRKVLPSPTYAIPLSTFGFAIGLAYLADRTGFWQKEQKQYDAIQFFFLCIFFLACGLITVKRGDKDLGFLNREQTDEWKGWMQIAILIYHYLGASKLSGIYNPVRVLVAAYLFMTGYGHTTFYLIKADFGFLRIAQVLVRLNLLTISLAYAMNTNYLFYYFAPLVSFWFLVIYTTFFVGSRLNDRIFFVLAKIIISMIITTTFFTRTYLLDDLFTLLSRYCHIDWHAREWAFRVTLDIWIVYFGMLAAVAYIKVRELRLSDHPRWSTVRQGSIIVSAVALVWFFAFEIDQPSKFTYNRWHPYVSIIPVLAFAILRNATPVLRSASSRFFAFIGTCSLETFILQYHFWLAADTKGILLFIPGTRWRPINFVIGSIMFVWLSYKVAGATGEMTSWICGGKKKVLQASAPPATAEVIPLVVQNREEDVEKRGDTRIEGNALDGSRWIDRLADGSSSTAGFRMVTDGSSWGEKFTLPVKIALGMIGLWVINMSWPPSA